MSITAIMIDTREPEWVQKLTFTGKPVTVIFLEQGDLMAATDDGNMLLVERKTPDDLLGSLSSGRLFHQLANMLDVTRWSYLVITGDLLRGQNGTVVTERGQTGWSWAALQGALLTAQEMGIFVVYAAGDVDYETCVLRLGQRDHKFDMPLAPVKMPRILSAKEAVLAALPGIGMERMQVVLNACGTPAWGLVALTDLNTNISGIPHNVKIKVRSALGLRDADQMVIVTDDQNNEVLQVAALGSQ